MDGFLWGIGGFVACAIIAGVWGLVKKKYGISDADALAIAEIKKRQTDCRQEVDEKIEAMNNAVEQVRKALPPLLNGVFALLVSANKNEGNGEIEVALNEFTEAFRREFKIKML